MKSEVFSMNYQFVIVYTFTNEQKTMQSLFQQSIFLFYFSFPNQDISVSPTYVHQRNQFIVLFKDCRYKLREERIIGSLVLYFKDNINMGLEETDFECTDQALLFTC